MSEHKLLEGSVRKNLYDLSFPMAIGIVFMMLVNIIDTYWASRLGTDALAAMSFAFPIIGIIINISLGLMIGVSVAVARVVGEGDALEARRLAAHAMYLGLVIVAIVVSIGLATIDPVFRWMGAPEALLGPIGDYMIVWYFSALFLVVPMMLNGVLRAHGDAITARNVMILSAVFNGLLDPLLIFGVGSFDGFGLQGAAMATGASRALTFVYALFIATRSELLDLHIPSPKAFWHSVVTVLRVGIPATVTNVLGPVATALITTVVSGYGPAAVAAYGIGARVDSLMLIPATALSSGLSPFIGQNWGGRQVDRVKSAFRLSTWFSLGWGMVAAGVMMLGAPFIAAVFSDDPKVIEGIVTYLTIIPLGYGAYSILMMVGSTFNAVDHATRATVLSVLRSLLLAVPFAWLGSRFGLFGIFWGLTLASLVSGVLGLAWIRVFFFGEQPSTKEAPIQGPGGGRLDSMDL